MTGHHLPDPPPTSRLWSAVDVAGFLYLSVDQLDEVLASPDAPAPLRLGRTQRWVPRLWIEWADPTVPAATSAPQRLWSIGDVADFLAKCENTTNRVLRDERDVPAPVLDGRHRRWDPRAWWEWAERRTRAGAATVRPARATTAGRATRV